MKWQSAAGYRWAELSPPPSEKVGFTLLPSATTGITFSNRLTEAQAAENRILENGSGVALGDIDGDGWCDIYFCRLDGPNVLYRNLGDWKFEDITASAGVACVGQFSTGAVFADVDGDGDLDLLVNGIGAGTRCFLNDGKGHFSELNESGLIRKFGSTSLALADVDGDGDLDLYVTNYRTTNFKDAPPGVAPQIKMVDGKPVATPADRFTAIVTTQNGAPAGALIEKGEADFLYLNDGKGHFVPASWTDGSFRNEDGNALTGPPQDWGLSVMFRDLNGDGAPDLYVCNDYLFFPDRVWMNDGHGKFRAIPKLALRHGSGSSMTVDFADINRDGFDDFFVADMLSRDHQMTLRQRPRILREAVASPFGAIDNRPEVNRNTLFLNRGDGTFAEIAHLAGLPASEWSWSAVFLDVDLDGYEDLLVATGNFHDVLDGDMLKQVSATSSRASAEEHQKNLLKFPHLERAKLAFRNRRDLTFEEIGAAWGFEAIGVSHGMALADLDHDGDLDVVINNLNAPAGIYRNDTAASRVAVRLKGRAPNTAGVGARVRVLGGPVAQSQEMICGGRYLSGDEAMRVFAAGSFTNDLTIEVNWRGGQRSVVAHARANRVYEIDDAGATTTATTLANEGARGKENAAVTNTPAFFQDVSALIAHVHHDEPFDDFERQPLLPKRLSQLGPGVAWFDFDGDGWDDLLIGSGKGGRLAVFRNDTRGGFQPIEELQRTGAVARDQTTILGWSPNPGDAVVFVGAANYEDGKTNGACVRAYDLKRKEIENLLPARVASVGAIALADIDGDGDLDLFVGGRVLAGRYPEAASSCLYRNVDGKFELDEMNSARLDKIGLVSAAVFSDIDGDGDADLILACEWGPVRIFRNDTGQFVEATKDFGLDKFTGWWNGVTTGDVDGDGRLDIIASNWGRNTKYRTHLEQPLRIYYGDFDGNGTLDVIEAHFDRAMNKIVPWRDWETVTKAVPYLIGRTASFRAFAAASVAEILGDDFVRAKEWSATTLDSMVFLNRGSRFEAKPLPVEAQFAPAFGVCVGDFDGDGHEDIFLSQNFFDQEWETSRYDAGQGLWLRGDGAGNFSAMSGSASGIKIFGEQRGCALADFDGDGRVDLVVAQNAAATKLFRNVGAKPGLRVRLNAGPHNSTGVGAVARLLIGEVAGPAREVHLGSGYWSQDSAVQVMNGRGAPTAMQVRWPGGKTTTTAIPVQAREIEVNNSGELKVLH
ncbi:MAG: VCBS repeat-containing protein [Verrucomicrobia bacterium]|nr:VCBS repeat-containing protein [Verrucomicrobiota bacterium]